MYAGAVSTGYYPVTAESVVPAFRSFFQFTSEPAARYSTSIEKDTPETMCAMLNRPANRQNRIDLFAERLSAYRSPANKSNRARILDEFPH